MKFPSVPAQLVVVVLPLTLVIMGDSLMYVVLPTAASQFGIAQSLGMSASFWIGAALSINRFIRLASNTFAACIYEQYGLKSPFVLAVAMGALTTLAYTVSSSIWTLLVARALWGVSYSFMRLASQIVAFEFGHPARRGRYLGFFNAGQRLGSLVAVTVGAAVVAVFSVKAAFSILAVAGAIGVVVALRAPSLSVANTRASRSRARTPGWRPNLLSLGSAMSPVPSAVHHDIRKAIASLSLMRFSVAFASNGLAIATVTPHLVNLLEDDRQVFGLPIAAVALGGLLVGFRWFGDLALSVPLGHFSDRIGRARSIIASVAVMIGVLALVGIMDSPELFVLAIPWLFFSSVLATTSMDAAAGEMVKDEVRTLVMAKYANWQDLGGAFGPLVGLVVADALGFQAGYLIAAALLICTLVPLYLTAGRIYRFAT